MSERTFEGKVALVTGAATGIGAATARAFARGGATLVLGDVQEEAGAALAAELTAQGARASFVRCDVRAESDVKDLVDYAVKTYGALHVAYNNAGIEGQHARTADCTPENFDTIIAVNLRGVWLCMKHEIAAMLDSGGGAIVNCASVAGIIAFSHMPAYVASKHGVIGLTKTAGLEYAKKGIRVNAVCPGVIDTPLLQRLTPDIRAALAAEEPIGRMGAPEEIASAVLWLASPAASFAIGHALVVDGGWVLK